jgi:class I fructose-bisphosphate aldolase
MLNDTVFLSLFGLTPEEVQSIRREVVIRYSRLTMLLGRADQRPPYDKLNLSTEEMVAKVVKSAGKTLVLFSGGGMATDEEVIERARICIEQGATGLIFGRNLWQRDWDDAMKMTKTLKDIMLKV